MKKNYILSFLIVLCLLFSLTGCITVTINKGDDAEKIETVPADNKEEFKTKTDNTDTIKSDIEKSDEGAEIIHNTPILNEWVNYTVNADNTYTIKYSNGIPDDYMMSDKGSFKDITTWLSYAVPGYPVEVFRHVASMFLFNETQYDSYLSQLSEDGRDYLLSMLASLAWQIDHDNNNGDTKAMILDANKPEVYTFVIESLFEDSYLLQWDMSTNMLNIVANDGHEVEYLTTTFDSNILSVYMVAINEALQGNKIN